MFMLLYLLTYVHVYICLYCMETHFVGMYVHTCIPQTTAMQALHYRSSDVQVEMYMLIIMLT